MNSLLIKINAILQVFLIEDCTRKLIFFWNDALVLVDIITINNEGQ